MANHDDYCVDCGHNLMALDCSEDMCSVCCDSSSCPRHGDGSTNDEKKCDGCGEFKEDFHDSCGYCTDYCCDCSKCEFCEGYMEDLETFTCSRFGCSAAINGEVQCYYCRDGVCNSCGDGVDVDDWDDGSGSWDSTIGNRD